MLNPGIVLGDRYELLTPEQTRQHGLSMSQIKKKGTVYRSYNELSKEDPGISIDLFVIENTYDKPLQRNLHGLSDSRLCSDLPENI